MPTEIVLDDTYRGAFEVVGADDMGNPLMESVQSVSPQSTVEFLADVGVSPPTQPRQPELEVNTVKWTVLPDGSLSGTAKFLAVRSHDIVNATLTGTSPTPEPGTNYRLARVQVSFNGGTGRYATAGGVANVTAKLFDDGLSVGHIVGNIVL